MVKDRMSVTITH